MLSKGTCACNGSTEQGTTPSLGEFPENRMPQNCPGGVGVRWEEVGVEEDRAGQGRAVVQYGTPCSARVRWEMRWWERHRGERKARTKCRIFPPDGREQLEKLEKLLFFLGNY